MHVFDSACVLAHRYTEAEFHIIHGDVFAEDMFEYPELAHDIPALLAKFAELQRHSKPVVAFNNLGHFKIKFQV